MKRVSQIILSLTLMSMFFVVHVDAATSQGLDWGFEVGGQYNYDYVLKDSNNETLVEEVIHIVANTRPTIPNIVSVWDDLPAIEAEITWTNGSSVEVFALSYFMYAMDVEFVLPIGNWTLLTNLYRDSAHFDGTISDTGSYWGVEGTILVWGVVTTNIEYLKDDGLMAHYTLNANNGSLTVTRQGLSGGIIDLIMDNILYIGAGVAVILIVVCIYYVKKK